jgi:guanosine-3',5'-bis(diphosphate) 3'-pyrophosphohydrolase
VTPTGALDATQPGSTGSNAKNAPPLRRGRKPAAATDASPNSAVVSLAPLTETISKYLTPDEVRRVREAYRLADEAHLGQFRASGEPYISHPIAVAQLVAEWRLDAAALMAALLHDVMEDKGIPKQELVERFGMEVAELVDGLSKLERIEFASKEEQQAESFRKMLLAMARDVRVILIKLADRLHNMRTLSAMVAHKRRRIARETLDIYAPIAHRLGLNVIYRELQDLSFAHLYPHRFAVLQRAVFGARGNRREVVTKILQTVKTVLPQSGISAEVYGREKTIYGIYRKMQQQKKSFSEVLDIYGFRVVVDAQPACYLALGALHGLYRPVPGKFKDYIAIPKLNGYQSLHTTLVGPYGTPVEFQIRTRDMHHVAESGVAAHWLYSEEGDSLQSAHLNTLQKKTLQWLQSLLDIQSQTGDSSEFLEHVKVDLFPDAVYVFTPKGKIISLPRGATPVDFAYSIHTDVGNQTVAAKVNGQLVPLRTELASGDSVEVITVPGSRPNAAWLNFVRTGKARSEIRHYLRTMKFEESVELGERLLMQAFRQLDTDMPPSADPLWDKLARGSGARSREEILADIGLGKRLAAVVARRFVGGETDVVSTTARAEESRTGPAAPIAIQGTEGLAVQLPNCCSPIPGDDIIGYMRLGHGLVVHTDDCPTARRQRARDPDRWVDVKWSEDTKRMFSVRVDIFVRNERGVLSRVAAEITDADANIAHVTMQEETTAANTLHFTLQVENRQHLARVIRALRRVPQVEKLVRLKN